MNKYELSATQGIYKYIRWHIPVLNKSNDKKILILGLWIKSLTQPVVSLNKASQNIITEIIDPLRP
jgi:hypothetical protein